VFLGGKKIVYDLNTAGPILMQFYMLLYLICFFKSSKSGQSCTSSGWKLPLEQFAA